MRPDDVAPGPLLVDTDVFSMVHYGKGTFARFEPFLVGRSLVLSFSTVGELRAWGIKRNWSAARRARLESYLKFYVVARPTTTVVDEYALLHAALGESLKAGGVNDMWTAAIALALGVPVVTNNLRDFLKIQSVEPRLVVVHPDLPIL